jgi:hypothetical protein
VRIDAGTLCDMGCLLADAGGNRRGPLGLSEDAPLPEFPASLGLHRAAQPPLTSDPDAALIDFTLKRVPDDWQFGHKRVRFANSGGHGINVFLYEESDYLFLNENFALVRPPNVRRSYADIHLEMMGGQFASSADVVRRRPTSDLELQHALINLSTVFGIGISLLVEGVLVLLVSLASGFRRGT